MGWHTAKCQIFCEKAHLPVVMQEPREEAMVRCAHPVTADNNPRAPSPGQGLHITHTSKHIGSPFTPGVPGLISPRSQGRLNHVSMNLKDDSSLRSDLLLDSGSNPSPPLLGSFSVFYGIYLAIPRAKIIFFSWKAGHFPGVALKLDW